MSTQPEPYEYMSSEKKIEADLKIKQLEDFIVEQANLINTNSTDKEYTVDEATVVGQDKGKKKDVKFYYFIGRLNPPHNGHIAALRALVDIANQNDSIPLILLGSGPGSDDETKRTMDNPISFETKEKFIRAVLPGRYIIKKMTNPARDVSEYVENGLKDIDNIENVNITHIAGGKDEDATKLTFALKSAEKTASELAPDSAIDASVVSIEPETTDTGSAMSATKVRKDAYKAVLNRKEFEGWPQQYKEFYGPMAIEIYNEIKYPLTKIPEEEREEALKNYISSGIIPQVKKGTKRKKGGSRKNKRKTQIRKSKRKNYKKRRTYKRH